MNIQSRQDFLAWITERNYFEEIFFANIQPMPTLSNTGQVPERVSFDIGIPTTIDWTAGEKTLFIFQRVLASGITEWSSSDIDFEPDPIYADRGISLEDDSEELTILIDNTIRLKCTELEVSACFEARIFNPPELTEREVSIEVPNSMLPTPKQWVSWFEAAGLKVAWRIIHDEARSPDEVPQHDYSGWFLQELDRINDTNYGLMMSSCKPTDSGFYIHIDFWKDQENPEGNLWIMLAKVVSTLPGSKVVCGNCHFSGIEWYRSVEYGQIYLDKLFPRQS
jgi:hypothetical protein